MQNLIRSSDMIKLLPTKIKGGWVQQLSVENLVHFANLSVPRNGCRPSKESPRITFRLIFALYTGVDLLFIFQLQAFKVT